MYGEIEPEAKLAKFGLLTDSSKAATSQVAPYS